MLACAVKHPEWLVEWKITIKMQPIHHLIYDSIIVSCAPVSNVITTLTGGKEDMFMVKLQRIPLERRIISIPLP